MNAGVMGIDRHFCPATRFTDNAFNFNNAVIYFWHFLCKQGSHELITGTRQKNLWAFWLFADFFDLRSDPVTLLDDFFRDHVFASDHGFGATHIHGNHVTFSTFYRTDNDFAFPTLIFGKLSCPFCFTYPLRDDLLRCLGGDTTKFQWRQGFTDKGTNF